MEQCTHVSRCLICRRTTQGYSSVHSKTLVINANLLQNFLNCFHMNVLDSEFNHLPTSCQFCLTCEKFISEWSSIQTQMTLLTRRAAQLKATLSTLFLSAPQIQQQTHNEDVTDIIESRMQNSQEVERPLMFQQIVDVIRLELQKKYSVSVIVDKIQLPCQPRKFSQQEFAPLAGHCDNNDEPVDDRSDEDESNAVYLPSEHEIDNEETSKPIFELKIKTEEPVRSHDSKTSVKLKEIKVNRKSTSETKSFRKIKTDRVPTKTRKRSTRPAIIPDGPNRFKFKRLSFQRNEVDETYTCDACGFKSGPTIISIRNHLVHHLTKKEKRKKHQTTVIPDGPNRFKYNGYSLKLNDEDRCYYCGTCEFHGNTNVHSVLLHIREIHFTEEDKLKFTAVKTSGTEWLYGGEYKISRVGEKFKCVSCGSVYSKLSESIWHIRNHHVPDRTHGRTYAYQPRGILDLKTLEYAQYSVRMLGCGSTFRNH